MNNSQSFRANSTFKGSRLPRLVEHFWVLILGASCSNILLLGTVRPSHCSTLVKNARDHCGAPRSSPGLSSEIGVSDDKTLHSVNAEKEHIYRKIGGGELIIRHITYFCLICP